MHTYMATKTISIDMEAYERLRSARREPRESFSQVIKRAHWPTPPKSAIALLDALDATTPLSSEEIARLEQAQADDRPPEDPWQDD